MKRLFNIEWNKIFYNKGTKIFISLYFLMIILMGIILPKFKINVSGNNLNLINFGVLDFPFIWHNITWVIGFGKFFLAIIIINNITNEYSYGTFRQNTIDGLSKTEFLKSKIIMNTLITLFSTLIVGIIVITLGSIFSKNLNIFNGSEFLLAYFVEVLTFCILCIFLSFLLKKNAFVILSLIILNIGESIITGIEYYAHASSFFLRKPKEFSILSNYLPLNSNGKIIGYPSLNLTDFNFGNNLFIADSIEWNFLAINIFYAVLFSGLTLLLIKKRDL